MNWTVSEMFLLPASNPRVRRKARNPLRRGSARRSLLQTPTLLRRGDDPLHALRGDPAFGFWRLDVGGGGSISPLILAHRAFCASAIFRRDAAPNFLRFRRRRSAGAQERRGGQEW